MTGQNIVVTHPTPFADFASIQITDPTLDFVTYSSILDVEAQTGFSVKNGPPTSASVVVHTADRADPFVQEQVPVGSTGDLMSTVILNQGAKTMSPYSQVFQPLPSATKIESQPTPRRPWTDPRSTG